MPSDSIPTPNLRGEITVELGGATRRLRLGFRSMLDLEAALGRSFLEVIDEMVGKPLKGADGTVKRGEPAWPSFAEVAAIIHAGIVGGGTPATLDQVGEWMIAEGRFGILARAALALLAGVANGGKAAEESVGGSAPQPTP